MFSLSKKLMTPTFATNLQVNELNHLPVSCWQFFLTDFKTLKQGGNKIKNYNYKVK